MTPYEEKRVFDLERRLERRAHWYRVRVVFGVLAVGAMALWALVEFVAWAATRFAL